MGCELLREERAVRKHDRHLVENQNWPGSEGGDGKTSHGPSLGYSRPVPPQADTPSDRRPQTDPAIFATTHWSVVVAAGQTESPLAVAALETLCRTYWYPLYVYVRRQGQSPHDAQDLTQEFFARLLEKQYLRLADPDRGKFRAFLLKSLKHFLVNEWEKARTQKRGSGQCVIPLDAEMAESRYATEPIQELTLDQVYEKRWAVTLIETALAQLRESYAAAGRRPVFETLKGFIWGDQAARAYAEVARQLELTDGAVKVAVHRLRGRYRELLRAEIAKTVATAGEVDEELRHLMAVLSA